MAILPPDYEKIRQVRWPGNGDDVGGEGRFDCTGDKRWSKLC
ncbi:hypothetical protein ACFLUE_02695 [Chloroflexota bacterium]